MGDTRHLTVAGERGCDLLLVHAGRSANVDAWLRAHTDLRRLPRLRMMARSNRGATQVVLSGIAEEAALALAEELAAIGATAGVRPTA